jgi:3-oxoacyl-[acyl-carrier protein] reductase
MALHARMVKLKQEGGTPLQVGAGLCAYLASAESDGLTGRLIAAPWDPWPFSAAIKEEIAASDIYTLRRIVPKERDKDWGER